MFCYIKRGINLFFQNMYNFQMIYIAHKYLDCFETDNFFQEI